MYNYVTITFDVTGRLGEETFQFTQNEFPSTCWKKKIVNIGEVLEVVKWY
jgi:hypothetical protein